MGSGLLAGVWGGQPLSLALRASSHFSIWDWPHFRASGSVWKLPSRSVRPPCHDTVTSQVPSLLSLICTTGGGGDVSAMEQYAPDSSMSPPSASPALFKGAHYPAMAGVGEAERGVLGGPSTLPKDVGGPGAGGPGRGLSLRNQRSSSALKLTVVPCVAYLRDAKGSREQAHRVLSNGACRPDGRARHRTQERAPVSAASPPTQHRAAQFVS
jgi:hypothetical protein